MNVDTILDGDIDIYEFLGVEALSTLLEIKRSYRRKALRFHPDKNPSAEAAEKFQLLAVIYEILSDDDLRTKYDKLREQELNRKERISANDQARQQFKRDLQKAEAEAKLGKGTTVYNNVNREAMNRIKRDKLIEMLREEGLKRRRQAELKVVKPTRSSKYISFRDIPIVKKMTFDSNSDTTASNRSVLVKWKHRPELKDLFDENILLQIMQIFGRVKKASINSRNPHDRYDSGTVEFEEVESVARAISHNYRKSASTWDGTSVRKLASLLRECEPLKLNKLQINEAMKLSSIDINTLSSCGYLGELLGRLISEKAGDS